MTLFERFVQLLSNRLQLLPIEHRHLQSSPLLAGSDHCGEHHFDKGALAERAAISRYRLDRDGSQLTVSFVRNAEAHHLPTALASMTAKYVRELLMLRLNRYFQAQLPQLRPTAGYVQDGRRYLTEIKPVLKRLHISPSRLVRAV